VDRLFTAPAFVDFGPCQLALTAAPPPVRRVEGDRAGRLRARLREECPRCPGVYGMLTARGELIYVGKAKCLRPRLFSYFRPASRDAKMGRIIRQTAAVVWERCPSEFAALHRELELIRRWRPRFNVAGQPHFRRRTYVCLGRKPAPYAFLTRKPPKDAAGSFGPIFSGEQAREAVRRLNDWFALRDCPQRQEMVFADQGDLFAMERSPGCLRLEIGTCLGPCAAACTRTQYTKQVKAAHAFLSGADPSPLQRLEKEMAEASASQAFERAASLRDRLEALTWLHQQLDAVRRMRQDGCFVYPVLGCDAVEVWYLIRHGRAVAAVAAPKDAAARKAVAARLTEVYKTGDPEAELESAEHLEGGLLVAAWFRKRPQERAKAWGPEEALARCVVKTEN
jgi:excinuclease ABC subunit C